MGLTCEEKLQTTSATRGTPSMYIDSTRHLQLDVDARSNRYFRNAVERHWDPYEIDLEQDEENLLEEGGTEEEFDGMRAGIAKFGAGEQAVTEDLAPLAIVLDDIDDQMFITTQLYEEAKHTEFFDRYWREVIHHVEDERGWERSSPTDDRWFNEPYWELFERNEEAMTRLLTDDTPENRATAYCYYHLTIEGILAQTGYYGMQSSYSGERFPEVPHLPGLVEGFSLIRSDEGRHVGFGMARLKALVESGAVSVDRLRELVAEPIALTQRIVDAAVEAGEPGVGPAELAEYAAERHTQRMTQIADASAEIPDVEELTRLSDD
jgi:ribonucleoside-diphosphate reductase beta chain